MRNGPENAQEDLDEAREIAERGPMKLFLADIHLHRARLFGRVGEVFSNQSSVISGEKYPWESPQHDLAEARKIITKVTTFKRSDGVIESHSYRRRLPELEDAEQAIRGQPPTS